MKTPVVLVVIALCAVSALSLAEDGKNSNPSATETAASEFGSPSPPPSPPTTTKTPPTTTKTTPVTTKTTTTTTAKTTTTTAKTTTTTAKTTTTTAKTTTTTAKTTTTTAKTTTTTAKTTVPPSPKPTQPANLTTGNYTLSDKKGLICLMAQLGLQIRLATPKANGTFIVQPKLTKVDGSCEEPKANLTLVFKEGFITFLFNKSAADNIVYVDTLSFSLSYPLSKGGNEPYAATNKSVHLFAAMVGHSYSCKDESLYMGKGLYLDVSQDRMQAFNLTKSNEFGTPDLCAADQPDYRVAIAVGVTLLVLIIIVVVAYLLGRRRRSDGYQSL